jgi:ribokinase
VRLSVVGHVEWVELLRIERFPARGDVVEAASITELAAGSGGIAAVQLAKLGAEVTFFTRLTDDERGHRARLELEGHGVRVEAVHAGDQLRRAFVLVDESSERTITVVGEKRVPLGSDPLPWAELSDFDGVCFFCGDTAASKAARRAPILVATARWLPGLKRAQVPVDALVRSGQDLAEEYRPGDLSPEPPLVVTTEGARGGSLAMPGRPPQRFQPSPLTGPAVDAYGCGDSFAAGLLFALAEGRQPREAAAFAARCGAACLAGEALTGQLRLGGTVPAVHAMPEVTP